MAVNTKKVQGRRKVRYESLEEFLDDAQRLSGAEVRTLGNWSQGQIYEHMARSLDTSIDGADFTIPVPVRIVLTLLMKRKFLKKEIPAGFKSTEKYTPGATSTADGLLSLQRAVQRQKQESKRATHPAFGNISRDEWNDFHLRHAEMHMSFLVNGQNEAS